MVVSSILSSGVLVASKVKPTPLTWQNESQVVPEDRNMVNVDAKETNVW